MPLGGRSRTRFLLGYSRNVSSRALPHPRHNPLGAPLPRAMHRCYPRAKWQNYLVRISFVSWLQQFPRKTSKKSYLSFVPGMRIFIMGRLERIRRRLESRRTTIPSSFVFSDTPRNLPRLSQSSRSLQLNLGNSPTLGWVTSIPMPESITQQRS